MVMVNIYPSGTVNEIGCLYKGDPTTGSYALYGGTRIT